MRKRIPYLTAAAVILGIELLIGFFVRDTLVRPYVGDILVTVLLCCLVKCVFPEAGAWAAVLVFFLSAGVELLQGLGLTESLGLVGTVLGIILGSTFDWLDLLCYLTGCTLFYGVDRK